MSCPWYVWIDTVQFGKLSVSCSTHHNQHFQSFVWSFLCKSHRSKHQSNFTFDVRVGRGHCLVPKHTHLKIMRLTSTQRWVKGKMLMGPITSPLNTPKKLVYHWKRFRYFVWKGCRAGEGRSFHSLAYPAVARVDRPGSPELLPGLQWVGTDRSLGASFAAFSVHQLTASWEAEQPGLSTVLLTNYII